jgi:hypothetical protein
MSTKLSLILGGLALAGLLQVVLARWLGRKTRALVAHGKRVPGRRIGATSKCSIDGETSRHDVIEFTTEDGRRGEVTSRIGVPWSRNKNQPITVLYDPDDLENAVIATWTEQWAGPAILYANGILMAIAAGVVGVLAALGVLPFEP